MLEPLVVDRMIKIKCCLSSSSTEKVFICRRPFVTFCFAIQSYYASTLKEKYRGKDIVMRKI